MKKIIFVLVVLSISICTGCSKSNSDLNNVKNGNFAADNSITVGNALDHYKYFKSRDWKATVTEQGRHVVTFKGTYDWENPEAVKYRNENNSHGAGWEAIARDLVITFIIKADGTFSNAATVIRHESGGDKEIDYFGPGISAILKNEPIPGF